MLRSPRGSLKFPKAQLFSPVAIGSNMIHYMILHAIVECGSAFFEDISKGNANFSELPHTLNIYGGINDVSSVLSSKGILEYNSSSSVLVLNRTSPSLLYTLLLIHYSTFHCHSTYR